MKSIFIVLSVLGFSDLPTPEHVPTPEQIRRDVRQWKSRFVSVEFVGTEAHLFDGDPPRETLRENWSDFFKSHLKNRQISDVILTDDSKFIQDIKYIYNNELVGHDKHGSDGVRRYTVKYRTEVSPADAPDIVEIQTRKRSRGRHTSPSNITPIRPLFPSK